MNVCNLPYCDFVVWTPKEFLSARSTIDTEFVAVTMEKCFNLWKKLLSLNYCAEQWINPMISRIEKENPVFVKNTYNENSPMVCCDNCNN